MKVWETPAQLLVQSATRTDQALNCQLGQNAIRGHRAQVTPQPDSRARSTQDQFPGNQSHNILDSIFLPFEIRSNNSNMWINDLLISDNSYLSEDILAFFPSAIRSGQEEHANRILPRKWQLKSNILSHLIHHLWSSHQHQFTQNNPKFFHKKVCWHMVFPKRKT